MSADIVYKLQFLCNFGTYVEGEIITVTDIPSRDLLLKCNVVKEIKENESTKPINKRQPKHSVKQRPKRK